MSLLVNVDFSDNFMLGSTALTFQLSVVVFFDVRKLLLHLKFRRIKMKVYVCFCVCWTNILGYAKGKR